MYILLLMQLLGNLRNVVALIDYGSRSCDRDRQQQFSTAPVEFLSQFLEQLNEIYLLPFVRAKPSWEFPVYVKTVEIQSLGHVQHGSDESREKKRISRM